MNSNSSRSEMARRFLRWVDSPADDAPASLVELAELAQAFADQSFERIDGKSRAGELDCRRGCAWCCYMPVEASEAETERALAFARRQFSDQQFAALIERIHRAAACYPLPADRPLGHNPACPFLQHGACAIYPARPLACRGWNSRSVQSCEKCYREGAQAARVPVDSRIRGVFANASEALNRGLARDGRGGPDHLVPALARRLGRAAG